MLNIYSIEIYLLYPVVGRWYELEAGAVVGSYRPQDRAII
jgi:hypothetical protein